MAATTEFDAVERAIVDHLFELQPSTAVGLGLHAYDGRLPDYRREATDRWAADAYRLLAQLDGYDTAGLPPDREIDRFLLRLLLESPLFDLRDARELDRNPMAYVGLFSLTPYLAREYAPAAARVDSLVKILAGVPAVLDVGRRRLAGPLPRPFVDLAVLMGEQLPAHFGEAEEFARRAGRAEELVPCRRTAEAAVAAFVGWLRETERPRADDRFALGPERFQRLLFVREGIEAPTEEIRRAGEADLARNRVRLQEIVRQSGSTPSEMFRALGDDHPAAPEVLSTTRAYVDEARAFVIQHDLASVPEPAVCRVEETPPAARALSTASMNPPGPFEEAASEGIYFVTLVDPAWTPAEQEEWLRSLNRPMLRNITVHEVYPGHYLQFLHLRARPGSLARKVYLSSSFVEGWAHYAEQLAIEAGLGRGSPSAEIAQLHDALLRNCRLLSAIGLHTAGWSVARATELFRTEAHMDQLPAEREAIRGTFDPVYFCYTLGKLKILEARARLLGPKFGGRLRAFHDAVLATGSPPIGLLETMLASP